MRPELGPRAVLYLAHGDHERHQLELMQPYCERHGYEIVSVVGDLPGAIAMVEHGLADRVVIASREYLAVPVESVTREIPTAPGHGERPRRLR